MRFLLTLLNRRSTEVEPFTEKCPECGGEWWGVILRGFGAFVGADRCPWCYPPVRSFRERITDPSVHPGVNGAEWNEWIGVRGQWALPTALPLRRTAWGRLASFAGVRSYATVKLLHVLDKRLRYRGGRKERSALRRLRDEVRHRPSARLMLSDDALRRVNPWT